MNEFQDKVAVITGAGRGIGRGIALRCAQEGMKVVLAGYGMESISRTAQDLQKLGAETLIVQTDVSQLADVENLAEESYAAFGAVDLVVNNAGVVVPGSVIDSTIDDWNWVMDVNFNGVLYGMKVFVARMMEQETSSHIVNVSSVSGIIPGGGSYGVSKHAVVVLTESYYYELARLDSNVNVSVYCPGWVNTEFDTIDRSRPDRFNSNATKISDKQRADMREALSKGHSIDESAGFFFDGLKQNKLYFGPKAFLEQLPELDEWVRDRSENILNEVNPEISSD